MNATIEKHKIIASSRSRQLTQEVIEYQQMPEGPEKQAKCEKIMMENERIILSVCKRYLNQVEEEDLLQEARLGFFQAMQHFDATKETHFISYCINGIKIAISRFFEKQVNPIRVSPTVISKENIMKEASIQFQQKQHRMPNLFELSKITGIPVNDVKMILTLPKISRTIDEPIHVDDDVLLKDTIEDDSASLEELCEEKEHRAEILKLFHSVLTEREQAVVWAHTIQKLSLNSIAQKMHLSRERIRQIEQNAFLKFSEAYMRFYDRRGYEEPVELRSRSMSESQDIMIPLQDRYERNLKEFSKVNGTPEQYFAVSHMLCLEDAPYISQISLRETCHINPNTLLNKAMCDDTLAQSLRVIKEQSRSQRKNICARECSNFYQIFANRNISKVEVDLAFTTLSKEASKLAYQYFGEDLNNQLDWSCHQHSSEDTILSNFVIRPLYAKILYFREFGQYPLSFPEKEDAKLQETLANLKQPLEMIPIVTKTKLASQVYQYQ